MAHDTDTDTHVHTDVDAEDTPSRAAIAGHPMHPMVVPFPITLLSAVFVTDIVYWYTGDAFWVRASYWLLVAGIVTGGLAGVLGLIDFVGIRKVRSLGAAWIHSMGNVIALVIAAVNLVVRGGDLGPDIVPTGMFLSLLTLLLLLVTGWYGGELAYRHKIGVAGHHRH